MNASTCPGCCFSMGAGGGALAMLADATSLRRSACSRCAPAAEGVSFESGCFMGCSTTCRTATAEVGGGRLPALALAPAAPWLISPSRRAQTALDSVVFSRTRCNASFVTTCSIMPLISSCVANFSMRPCNSVVTLRTPFKSSPVHAAFLTASKSARVAALSKPSRTGVNASSSACRVTAAAARSSSSRRAATPACWMEEMASVASWSCAGTASRSWTRERMLARPFFNGSRSDFQAGALRPGTSWKTTSVRVLPSERGCSWSSLKTCFAICCISSTKDGGTSALSASPLRKPLLTEKRCTNGVALLAMFCMSARKPPISSSMRCTSVASSEANASTASSRRPPGLAASMSCSWSESAVSSRRRRRLSAVSTRFSCISACASSRLRIAARDASSFMDCPKALAGVRVSGARLRRAWAISSLTQLATSCATSSASCARNSRADVSCAWRTMSCKAARYSPSCSPRLAHPSTSRRMLSTRSPSSETL
mmetsp:Transcript_15261/g.44108  ORF Transcript_15261/g.44108 Transcript_15261/m.44108 type:complete len:485 (+) Transcript_15261:2256-3710(+)